jgi:hypothetical protein
MDIGQLSQMTTWLDEEHRRDRAELVRLQQQVERQETELQDQSHTIKSLEERVAALQGQLLRFGQLESSIDQLKENVVHMLDQAEERRQQEAREAERIRAIERDNLSKALNEIRRDLQRLPRLEEDMNLRKEEQRRVSDTVLVMKQDLASLTQEVENKLRGLSFLEDGRQQDAKRIALLRQESLEAFKRIEQQGSRLQRVEDVMQRQERDTAELKQVHAQLRTAQREFIEGQLLELEQMKRQMTEWNEVLEVETKKIEGFSVRFQEFSEAFREDRQVVESVERFQEGIRRDQTQVSELQRLAEERQKRQLEQWEEENEKRWGKELLRWDHQWGEQAKRNHQFDEHFREVETRVTQHRKEIDAAWKFLESQISFESQESRRWLGEMTRLLEERPKKE